MVSLGTINQQIDSIECSYVLDFYKMLWTSGL